MQPCATGTDGEQEEEKSMKPCCVVRDEFVKQKINTEPLHLWMS